MTPEDYFTWLYERTLLDIQSNRHLESHRRDILGAIDELKQAIGQAKEEGLDTDELEKFKNALYYLLYEIAERT